MLIDSPRLSARDRDTWARWEHYDALLSRDQHLNLLEDRAVRAVREFAAAGPFYVSVSWGKDSVVAAHLAALAIPDVRLVWARCEHFEMPECGQVRDQFLAMHPRVSYEERLVVLRNPKRGEPGYDTRHLDPHADHQDFLREELSGRYVSGLRAEESRMRRMSIAHRGILTPGTCRPLAYWQATHVFAYLHREALPTHPAYAMTMGGHYDRRWLRVHVLCSAPPPRSAVYGQSMDDWEDHYYSDVIKAAHTARADLWRHEPQ